MSSSKKTWLVCGAEWNPTFETYSLLCRCGKCSTHSQILRKHLVSLSADSALAQAECGADWSGHVHSHITWPAGWGPLDKQAAVLIGKRWGQRPTLPLVSWTGSFRGGGRGREYSLTAAYVHDVQLPQCCPLGYSLGNLWVSDTLSPTASSMQLPGDS